MNMNIIYFGLNSNRSFISGKKTTYDNWSVQYRLKKKFLSKRCNEWTDIQITDK